MKRYTKKDEYGNYIIGDLANLGEVVQKLGKIEDLEEKIEFELLNLFGLIGKKAYLIKNKRIHERTIDMIFIEKSKIIINFDFEFFGLQLKYLNEDWFLTREEAEKRLEEMK
jgi:hypothetical protein